MQTVAGRDNLIRLVESKAFQNTIIGLIVFNAITLGLDTSDAITDQIGGLLHLLDRLVVFIFVVELALRLVAHRLAFFKDPWSWFDVVIVGISLVPAAGGFSVLRALRILRALRLVSAVRGMRLVVDGLLRAIPAMTSIIALLGLVLYVGAVLANQLYGDAAPERFGHLGRSLFTLFQVMTGEAWPDIADEVMAQHPSAWIFFVLFILTSTFVVLNLFTAVIVSFIEPQHGGEPPTDSVLLAEIRALREEVAQLRAIQGAGLAPNRGSGEATIPSGRPSSVDS
jgi:voltage-gated sodium channel